MIVDQDQQPISDLTVAIIACDNERTIETTLKSVSDLAGRIVVVDSGSTDSTKDICAQYGAEVVEHDWMGHVKQKQFALELCDTEWVLSLDSDEAPEDDLKDAIRRAVGSSESAQIAGYEMNRCLWFGDQWLRHAFQPEWRLRLVRTTCACWTGYDPHDKLVISDHTKAAGGMRRLSGTLRHDAFEDVADMLRKQIAHGIRAGESYYRMGRKSNVFRTIGSPAAAMLKQVILRSAWRDGWVGWIAASAVAINCHVKNMRLLELQNHPPAVEKSEQTTPPPAIKRS